jgi:NAD(P)-dependent dehydrogenase (short-subunit alcohol dehydrogenase family)
VANRGNQPELLTKTLRDLFEVNVIGNIHLFNLFTPLILKGQAKKVIAISTGLADPAFTSAYDVKPGALYAASKAAMNLVVAKYSAQYRKDGVLFLALSPGLVDVGHYNDGELKCFFWECSTTLLTMFCFSPVTPEQMEGMGGLMAAFAQYAPHFKGPITPEQSVAAMKSVIADVSVEKGNAGDFLSHHGNKQWL